MHNLALHTSTRRSLEQYQAKPAHALLLVGPTGSGKQVIAEQLATAVLDVASLDAYPYSMVITPEDGKAISIETVRKLEQFLKRKVPSTKQHNRAIIIIDAHKLGIEAQNALLKTIEEPPEGTFIIMTVNHVQSLLPTIRSRVQSVTVHTPSQADLQNAFSQASQTDFQKAYNISGGLPGLMHAMLTQTDHPLSEATERARAILGATTYERLLLVDSLAKQRTLAIDIAFIMQQMAHVSLLRADDAAAKRWKTVLQASYDAAETLAGNGQPKLALTKLMLSL